jgi:N-acetylglutamate synthase-like GNAT family acetyltransferase
MNATVMGSPAGVIKGALRDDLASIRWLLGLHACMLLPFDVALLRSLVVADGHVRQGLGRKLVAAAEEQAKKLELRAIYLLTTSAQAYFDVIGFRSVSREGAPPEIRQCSQFSALYPSTSVLMVKP